VLFARFAAVNVQPKWPTTGHAHLGAGVRGRWATGSDPSTRTRAIKSHKTNPEPGSQRVECSFAYGQRHNHVIIAVHRCQSHDPCKLCDRKRRIQPETRPKTTKKLITKRVFSKQPTSLQSAPVIFHWQFIIIISKRPIDWRTSEQETSNGLSIIYVH